MRRRARRAAGVLLAAISCGACASYTDVRYAPAIQDTELRGEADDLQARVVVAWRGIEEPDGAPELRFRIRVENPGATLFTLVPAEFELLDGALVSVGTTSGGDLPPAVEAGRSATFDIVFPVPSRTALRTLDLAALTLQTRFQGGRWSWNTTFRRDEGASYPDPAWSVHVGVAWGLD